MKNRKQIQKYVLQPSRTTEIPEGIILSVGVQNNWPVLWLIVDLDQPKKTRKMLSAVTGQLVSEEIAYKNLFIGTVQLQDSDGGPYVVHYFLDLSS